jgi:hypothetical protein
MAQNGTDEKKGGGRGRAGRAAAGWEGVRRAGERGERAGGRGGGAAWWRGGEARGALASGASGGAWWLAAAAAGGGGAGLRGYCVSVRIFYKYPHAVAHCALVAVGVSGALTCVHQHLHLVAEPREPGLGQIVGKRKTGRQPLGGKRRGNEYQSRMKQMERNPPRSHTIVVSMP